MNYSKPQLTFYINTNKEKSWLVEFYCNNPDNIIERRRFQYRFDINKQRTQSDKISKGNSWLTTLSTMLNEGWNPFTHTPDNYIIQKDSGFIKRPKTISESITEAYELKLKQLTGDESPRTYKYIHKNFKDWLSDQYLDKLRPEAFTQQHAMAYADYLTNDGKKGRTFNNYRSVVKLLFNMLVERDIVVKNHFSKVKAAKVTEAEIVPFLDAELKQIWEHLLKNDYNLFVLTKCIFYLLLRPIEVLWLQVKHIDLTKGKINLPAAASKNRKSRSCNIPPALMTILKAWLKYDSINDYLFSKNDFTIGPVRCKRRQDLTDAHKVHLDKLEFNENISLYSYKYSGVIAARVAGISLEEIRDQAGHSSVKITEIYMQKLGLIKPSSFGSVDY